MSLVKTLTDAVVTAINAGSYSQAITAVARKRANVDLPTIRASGVPLVYVKTNGLTTEPGDRKGYFANYSTFVAVYDSAAQDSSGDIDDTDTEDSLIIVEEIQDELSKPANRKLATDFTYIPAFENDPIYDDTMLKEDTIFRSITQFTYQTLRTY